MKRYTCLVLLLTAVAALQAQDYIIRFEGSGEKTRIDTIFVRNLTRGTSLVLTSDEVLHLKSPVNLLGTKDNRMAGTVNIYPNPTDNYALLEFETPKTDNFMVNLYNISGIRLVQKQYYLPPGSHTFQITGIINGVYLLQINAGGYLYSGKLVSTSPYTEEAEISFISSINNEEEKDQLKSKTEKWTMEYTPGDKLLLTFTSGDYSTTISEVPVQQEIITGHFYACMDADSNNYPVVQIGNQVWMGRNLKTTRYIDGTPIPFVTGSDDWSDLDSPAYSWRNNDETSYKDSYGGLYNWYAVNTDKLCPVGWHVPADSEWIALENYLGGNSISGGKMKEAGTAHWNSPNADADNSTGFSMIGGGYREGRGGASFYELGRGGYLWSATEYEGLDARYRGFSNTSVRAERGFSSKSSGFSVRCLLNSRLPLITTAMPTDISDTSASCKGMVSSGDGSAISARGICWDTGSNPDTSSNRVMDEAGGEGAFTCILAGLLPNTLYYARTFAIINGKVFYGNLVFFKSNELPELIRDYDGNVYKTVVIGGQTWLAENLRTTHFNNGEPIPNVTSSSEWISLNTPGFCWRNNDEETYKIPYGALYNWYVAATDNICPSGLHVPTDSDWKNLEAYLGGRAVAGGKLKEAGTFHWDYPNMGADNSTKFTMLPGGYREGKGNAEFYELGRVGYLWSNLDSKNSTGPWYRSFTKDAVQSERGYSDTRAGFAIRCVSEDKLPEVPRLFLHPAISVSQTEVNLYVELITNGGEELQNLGFCWDTTHNPDTLNSHGSVFNGVEYENYHYLLTNLEPNTTYFVRPYAINSSGIGYGNEIELMTLDKSYEGSIYDVDGNIYQTVKIGSQTWLKENLKTTRYNDSTLITHSIDNTEWSNLLSGGYCWFNNDQLNKNLYGGLYNWYAVNSNKLCPSGWHIPGEKEWNELTNYLGGESVAGAKLKESGRGYWYSEYYDGGYLSNFSAIPAGFRSSENGYYNYGGGYNYLWSSSEADISNAWLRKLSYNSESLTNNSNDKNDGASVRCLLDSVSSNIPLLTTQIVEGITHNSAITKGKIISIDGAPVLSKGFCWSTHPSPTIDDFQTIDLTVSDSIAGNLKELMPNTVYYVRAFASNITGVGYGNPISFRTLHLEPNFITDINGNEYDTVVIGRQTWMKDNLKATSLNDGTEIANANEYNAWRSLTTPGYCWYNFDNAVFRASYGALYNMATIYTGKVCPIGWHVPSDKDWEILEFELGGSSVAGGKMKESGYEHWIIPNTEASNESGFTGLPSGANHGGRFYGIGGEAYWWGYNNLKETSVSFDYLNYRYENNIRLGTGGELGLAVRCIKNSAFQIDAKVNFKDQSTSIIECLISSDGGEFITERGICWSTSPHPDTSDFKNLEGDGMGGFMSNLPVLLPDSTYFVRAFAENDKGLFYSNELTLVPFEKEPVDLLTGLIAYFPFNGNADDESGNGYNGNVDGATLTTDRFGNTNNAYYFDGSTNNISINFNRGWNNHLSASVWLKPNISFNGTTSRKNIIIMPGGGFQMYYENGSIIIEIWDIYQQVNFYTKEIDLLSDSWYNISFSCEANSSVILCINGASFNIGTAPPEFNIGSPQIFIGTELHNYYFFGIIDDIRIYDRSLNSASMQSIYNEGN